MENLAESIENAVAGLGHAGGFVDRTACYQQHCIFTFTFKFPPCP